MQWSHIKMLFKKKNTILGSDVKMKINSISHDNVVEKKICGIGGNDVESKDKNKFIAFVCVNPNFELFLTCQIVLVFF